MKFSIESHRIKGPEIIYRNSPNQGASFKPGLPDALVLHYTAGSGFNSSVRSLCDLTTRVSAHLVIGRNGEIAQLVPFDRIAWHAGKSNYNGRSAYNNFSIGIEMDNAGLLEEKNGRYFSWFGKEFSKKDVVRAVHRNEAVPRYWHRYSDVQIKTVRAICRQLLNTYNIREILGHEEISPGRKSDPGPAFPLDELRAGLKLFVDKEPKKPAIPRKARVTASALNVRSLPVVDSDVIARPLQKGSEIEVIEKQDGWYKVRFISEGWVYGRFIKED